WLAHFAFQEQESVATRAGQPQESAGDLRPALTTMTESDVVGPAIAAEDIFRYSSLNPGMGTTIRRLAEFSPRTLALMHGPSFSGDGASALGALANDYDQRILRSRP